MKESSQGGITIFNSQISITISIRMSMARTSIKTREIPTILRQYGNSIYYNGNNNLIDLTNYYINDVSKIDLPRSISLETCTSSPGSSGHATAGRHTSRCGSKRTLLVNRNVINDKKDDGIVDTNGSNVSFTMKMNIHSKENIYSMNLKPTGSQSDMISERNIIDSIHSMNSRGSRITNNAPSEQASLVVVSEPDNVNDDNNNNVNTNNHSYNGIDIVKDYSCMSMSSIKRCLSIK